ncbi:MAG TPA: M20/M25/M40 family metallo-hydrolase [Acidimicrobiales bacterium]|nr:M20/M25/M40 family metallo-hydrolase [Acidimicrobiales bacterium]
MTDLADEAVALCARLIALDTTNPGKPERPAAELVAEQLSNVGIDGRIYELEEGRSNYVVRIEGDGTSDDALLLHGHLDVVPADPTAWRYPPFSGEVAEGCIWGRGAVDMKHMVAMLVASLRRMAADGTRPRRDLVLCLFADEEGGFRRGSKYMVEQHREVFDGVTAAVGELGGFSVTTPAGARIYPIQVAEKGSVSLRLRARGRAGHASMPHADNPVMALAASIAALRDLDGGHRLTPTTAAFLEHVGAVLGHPIDPADPAPAFAGLGSLWTFVEPTLHNTVTPTILLGGDKPNVIPAEAKAIFDCRFLPGHEDDMLRAIEARLEPNVAAEVLARFPAVESPWAHPLVDAMRAALVAEDPDAHPVPFMIPAGTDAKWLTALGIPCYGFAPLLLPPDLDFPALFHGVDERVPVAAVGFGARVLHRLLTTF